MWCGLVAFCLLLQTATATAHTRPRRQAEPAPDQPQEPGAAPQLSYTFIEQALRGGSVLLRCAARAAPPPAFVWLRDGRALPADRFSVETTQTATGDVVTQLQRSDATAADGGLYTCRATNRWGSVEHAARLNIYGRVSVRPLGTVRAVAGSDVTVLCPYTGYPISSVTWRRQTGESIGAEGRVRARQAALSLTPALPADAGAYTCDVTAPDGASASAQLDLQLLNPPKIAPFQFSPELAEGSAAQALCSVSSGDKPLYFSWLKDDAPLPPDLQIEEKSLNDFSLLVFPALAARHGGLYTCAVSNRAARARHSARLRVLSPPRWQRRPPPVLPLPLAAPLALPCAAGGDPAPNVTWHRRLESGGDEQWEQVGDAGAGWGAGGLRVEGGLLRGEAAGAQHRGRYRCRADNGVGAALTADVIVQVHEPAALVSASASHNVSVPRGAAAVLTCDARGDAPLAVRWYRAAPAAPLPARWTLRERGGGERGGEVHAEARLPAATADDGGEYRCLAENPYGRSERVFFLLVQEPPEAPHGVCLHGLGARWARVRWRARARPHDAHDTYWSARLTSLHAPAHTAIPYTLNLTALTADDSVEADGWMSLWGEVRGLRAGAAYSLQLSAGNPVGTSPPAPAPPLLLHTLQEPPSGAPQNLDIRATSIDELLISWSPPERDSWNGELLGYVATWRDLGVGGAEGRGTASGAGGGELLLAGLPPRAHLALELRAFNVAGVGPPARAAPAPLVPPGVPSAPPLQLHCAALSPRELRVTWRAPPDPALLGFDLHYSEILDTDVWSGPVSSMWQRVVAVGEQSAQAVLRMLRPGANYSVSVCARGRAGTGPASSSVSCIMPHDEPALVTTLRAAATGGSALLVAWLPPPGGATHYTLQARARGGAAREQRIDAREARACGELRMLLRPLPATPHELRVTPHGASGAGPGSDPLLATPTDQVSVRMVSPARAVSSVLGARVQLCCAAAGAVTRAWRPLPRRHQLTDDGDLIIDGVDASTNYTCSVRGAGGADMVTHQVLVLRPPPAPPAPRLLRRTLTALHLIWDPPLRSLTDPTLGYTVWWSVEEGAVQQRRVSGDTHAHALTQLPCGAHARVTLTAHARGGVSPHSAPLHAITRGDLPLAPAAREFVWANSTALRLNVLSWRAACPPRLALQLRPSPAGVWRPLPAHLDFIEVGGLVAGAWYEVLAVARTAGGVGTVSARYRAATLTHAGERLGPPEEMPLEPAPAAGGGWGGAALLAAALLLLLLLLLVLLRQRRAAAAPAAPAQQLYSTEPERQLQAKVPLDDDGVHEISPYATFVMGTGVDAETGCALHARGRANSPGLLATPRYGFSLPGAGGGAGGADSDTESSGSPCACHRPLALHLPLPLPLPPQHERQRERQHARPSGAESHRGGGARQRGVACRGQDRRSAVRGGRGGGGGRT